MVDSEVVGSVVPAVATFSASGFEPAVADGFRVALGETPLAVALVRFHGVLEFAQCSPHTLHRRIPSRTSLK